MYKSKTNQKKKTCIDHFLVPEEERSRIKDIMCLFKSKQRKNQNLTFNKENNKKPPILIEK